MDRTIIKLFVFLVCCLWVVFPGIALSQNPKEKSAVYTLGEVVVTGQGLGVEPIGTVREITSENIQEKGAKTLDEALELLPGLDIRMGAQGIPRINLRGLRSRHVILLLDGIPFNSTYDGQFDPSIIPTENIAKIKVSYGNHSVLYGQGGLGGVINIITKKGVTGPHGTALGEIGERGRRLSQVSLSGGKEKVDFFFSGSHFKRDGFRLSDDFDATSEESGGLRENSDRKRNNLFANVGFSPNDKWDIGIVLNYLQGEFGKPPSTINDGSDPFAARPKYERIDDFDGISGQISSSYDMAGPIFLRSWVFFNQLDEEENRYDDNNYNSMDERRSFRKENNMEVYGGTIQISCDLETAGLFTLALSAEKQEFESDGRIRDVNLGGGNWGLRSFDEEQDLNTYSTAIEYEASPFDDFGLVLGYSYHWLKKGAGGNDNHGSFLAGAHYDVSPVTRITGTVARKIRFPSIKQLYDETSGNTALTTEKSYNFELGIEQVFFRYVKATLTGFLLDVEDYIEKDEATDIFENNEKYRFQGFELIAETHNLEKIMLRAGYTFMDSEDRSSGTEIDDLEYRPKHKITFETKYRFDSGLSAYLDIMHVAGQYYYSRNLPIIRQRLNDYTLVSFKIDLPLLDDRLKLYFGADNIFDEDYEESYAFPQPGRKVYGGMEIRF